VGCQPLSWIANEPASIRNCRVTNRGRALRKQNLSIQLCECRYTCTENIRGLCSTATASSYQTKQAALGMSGLEASGNASLGLFVCRDVRLPVRSRQHARFFCSRFDRFCVSALLQSMCATGNLKRRGLCKLSVRIGFRDDVWRPTSNEGQDALVCASGSGLADLSNRAVPVFVVQACRRMVGLQTPFRNRRFAAGLGWRCTLRRCNTSFGKPVHDSVLKRGHVQAASFSSSHCLYPTWLFRVRPD